MDDLNYLAVHNIDRNAVSREIAEITSRMIYVTGFFHADLFVLFLSFSVLVSTLHSLASRN